MYATGSEVSPFSNRKHGTGRILFRTVVPIRKPGTGLLTERDRFFNEKTRDRLIYETGRMCSGLLMIIYHVRNRIVSVPFFLREFTVLDTYYTSRPRISRPQRSRPVFFFFFFFFFFLENSRQKTGRMYPVLLMRKPRPGQYCLEFNGKKRERLFSVPSCCPRRCPGF